jgi:UDP-N-acetylglucosamine transferase subunit ALG13
MIFVSVGTHEAPFDRLLRALDELNHVEQLVVQHGPSTVRPRGAECHEFLSFDAVVEHVREARAVVMHAGVGSVMISLANGKRPIVMPRLQRLGEHVDDHQLELARRLERYGLVTLAESRDALARALTEDLRPERSMNGTPALATELQAYLAEHLGTASS